MGYKKIHPTWDHTNVYEVSGRQSIKREGVCLVKITPRHTPGSCDVKCVKGSGSGRITWEDLQEIIDKPIHHIFTNNIQNIFILTDWEKHQSDDLNTTYSLLRTGDTICSHITPGLLKTLLRIYTTNAKRITEKSQGTEQFKCQQKHTQGRKGEREGYIAWRSRVF